MGSMEEQTEEAKVQGRSPIWYIIGVFCVLLIVLMIIPYYSVKLDPEPRSIPNVTEVAVFANAAFPPPSQNIGDIANIIRSSDMKTVADKIAAISCSEGSVCQAKAMYYFVQKNIVYVSDPQSTEYIESPQEVLYTQAGDCESGSLLLASLYESIGIDTDIILVPGHAYVRITMPDAPNKYRIGNYIYLDWTCKSCEFGDTEWRQAEREKVLPI